VRAYPGGPGQQGAVFQKITPLHMIVALQIAPSKYREFVGVNPLSPIFFNETGRNWAS
jgi:hypothetical protein